MRKKVRAPFLFSMRSADSNIQSMPRLGPCSRLRQHLFSSCHLRLPKQCLAKRCCRTATAARPFHLTLWSMQNEHTVPWPRQCLLCHIESIYVVCRLFINYQGNRVCYCYLLAHLDIVGTMSQMFFSNFTAESFNFVGGAMVEKRFMHRYMCMYIHIYLYLHVYI